MLSPVAVNQTAVSWLGFTRSQFYCNTTIESNYPSRAANSQPLPLAPFLCDAVILSHSHHSMKTKAENWEQCGTLLCAMNMKARAGWEEGKTPVTATCCREGRWRGKRKLSRVLLKSKRDGWGRGGIQPWGFFLSCRRECFNNGRFAEQKNEIPTSK